MKVFSISVDFLSSFNQDRIPDVINADEDLTRVSCSAIRRDPSYLNRLSASVSIKKERNDT